MLKITELRIINYKGFRDSGFIALSSAWNVIVGQNNAGKTAFIEGFRLARNEHRLHRNISFPRDHPFPTESRFVARMSIGRNWLKNAWLRRGGHFDLPLAASDQHGNRVDIDPTGFWEGDDLAPEIEFSANQTAKSAWPSHRLFEAHGGHQFAQIMPTADRKVGGIGSTPNGNSDTLPLLIEGNYHSYIYVFEAKRFAVGECGHEDTSILRPDATNLPAVLLKLAANPDLFKEFQQNVATIFPSIKGVTVTTKSSNFEVRLWPVDPETRRDDITVPLNESGTGVGQALSILYVAMTNEPGVIVIDEPNSFLHPGAAKKLIQILKRYPQHQYIISTHSPEVIGAAQPASLHLIRFNGKESEVETLGEAEIETKRMMLEEVGASLADIFSAERVIWVEGPTERECFDLIVDQELGGPVAGLSFVSLRNTGDLDGKQADAALDIYDALTRGGSILPVSLWFSFDNEGKSERQIEDLKRRCGGRAKILPRRMTENYLLHPAAIASVLNAMGEDGVSAEIVAQSLDKHTPNHMPKGRAAPYASADYLKEVDGANLLKEVFHEVTEAQQEYRKVRDGFELLRYILTEDRSSVEELVNYVLSLVQ